MPKTALEGKFSIPFCMAIAVLERKAGIAQFQDRKVRDKKVIELMKRVALYVDDELKSSATIRCVRGFASDSKMAR
jgi:2-methylcitrate dehydratase PrpD